MNLSQFSKHILNKQKEIQQKLSKTASAVATSLVEELTIITPVDTSKAISNWQVTLDTPSASEIDAHYPGEDGSTKSQSANQARSLASAVLKKKRPKQTIYISNTAEYIRDLEEGSSKQAPAHFIKSAVEQAKLDIPLIYRGLRNGR